MILDQTEVFIVFEINYGIHNFTNEATNISPNILFIDVVLRFIDPQGGHVHVK
jgi:hypothetical protein